MPREAVTEFDSFRPLRGAYVDCSYRVRELQNGELPPGHSRLDKPDTEWRDGKREGILGFSKTGYPMFEGQPHFDSSYRKYADVVMVERFRPAKNAVRLLCRDCGDTRPQRRRSPVAMRSHPLAVALEAARIRMDQTGGKSFICSVCGQAGRGASTKCRPNTGGLRPIPLTRISKRRCPGSSSTA
jgi:hypothetical protein